MTDDPRDAIRARCAELRRIARAADSTLGGHWYAAGDDVLAPLVDDEPFGIADAGDAGRAEHIATWDPAAVLELVAGAEEMCEIHKPGGGWVEAPDRGDPCEGCGYGGNGDFAMFTIDECPSLRATAKMIGARLA